MPEAFAVTGAGKCLRFWGYAKKGSLVSYLAGSVMIGSLSCIYSMLVFLSTKRMAAEQSLLPEPLFLGLRVYAVTGTWRLPSVSVAREDPKAADLDPKPKHQSFTSDLLA